MSTKTKREIVCPNCSKSQKLNMYTGVNNIQDPLFKRRILGEDFFDFRCKNCGYMAQMLYPTIFVDSKKAFVVALLPLLKQEEFNIPSKIDNFTKRKVKTLPELKEKIMIFDSDLNDVAIEMVKNNFMGIFTNKYNTLNMQIYFSHIDLKDNIVFAIFLNGDELPVYENVQIMVYKQSLEVLKSISYEDETEFLRIDRETVKRITSN